MTPFATSVLPWNVAVKIDGGDGTDRITYNNVSGLFDSTTVTATAPQAGHIDSPGVTSALNSQLVSFTNVENITANANPGEDEKLTVNQRDTSAADTTNLLFDPDPGDDDIQLVGLFNMVVDTDNYVGLTLNGNGGDDTFNITPGPIPVFVDGGDPIGATAGDLVNFQPTGDFVLESGPENDSGGFVGEGVQRVSFDHIEDVSVSGGTGSGMILGTDGDDDITITARDNSTHAGADGIGDFTVSVNNGAEVLFIDGVQLYVDALAGDDDIVLRTPAPNNAIWDVDLFIAGGPPAAPTGVGQQGDVFEVETPGTQEVIYSPTGIDTAIMELVTLSSVVTIGPFVSLVGGLPSSPGGATQIVYQGLGGGDSLTMNGTEVDDRFVVHPANGGSGSHRSNLAPTFDFNGADAVTATGGSSGSDEVIVEGTGNKDVIIASAETRMVTVKDSTGTTLKPVILGAGIDIVTLEAKAGDDTILVSPDPMGGAEVQFNVNGDVPNASDRLVVEDQGMGNTIQHHQAPDQRGGSIIVCALPPISYEGIEYVDILP
ncbi:MAG: hypothetical protein JJ992_05255, partial [Planctomycetes bacterium]|nr:hypothetical protein [Planctomycetota bacterium]